MNEESAVFGIRKTFDLGVASDGKSNVRSWTALSAVILYTAIGAGRPAAIAAAAAAVAAASAALTLLEQRTDNSKAIVCARVAQVNKFPVAASQF